MVKRISVVLFAGVLACVSPLRAEMLHVFAELSDSERITAEELNQAMNAPGPPLILDARNRHAYSENHLPGAVLPYTAEYYRLGELFAQGMISSPPDEELALAKGMEKYPKNATIVTYCNSNCKASARLLRRLKQLGYSNVRAMEEGIDNWKAKGYPVIHDEEHSGL